MRPAWAVSWRPWCRPPSTASTGLAAASWSSAATSRRSPPPSALCLPHYLPSEHHPTPDTCSSPALPVSSWASGNVKTQDECWILELKATDGCRADLGGVGAGRDTVTNLCSDQPGPSIRPAWWADLSSSLGAVGPQTVCEPALIQGHGVNSVGEMGPIRKPRAACLRLALVALPWSPDMVMSGSRGTCGVVHFPWRAQQPAQSSRRVPAGLPSLVPAPSSGKGEMGPFCPAWLTPCLCRQFLRLSP